MSVNDEDQMDDEGDEFMQAVREFFSAYKDDIGTIIRAYGKNVEQGPRMKFLAMLSIFALLAVIIGVLAYLSVLGIVSGDAVAFLIGSIVGYLFSFLRHYVVGLST
jgi:hypothetical protein